MKKIIRFLLAMIVLPAFLAWLVTSAVITVVYELLADEQDWPFWVEFHFIKSTKWYRFK